MANTFDAEISRGDLRIVNGEIDKILTVYVCATMWHENRVEMVQMIKSILKLDEEHANRLAEKNAMDRIKFRLEGDCLSMKLYREIAFKFTFSSTMRGLTTANVAVFLMRISSFSLEYWWKSQSRFSYYCNAIGKGHRLLCFSPENVENNDLYKRMLVNTPYGGRFVLALVGIFILVACCL